MSLSARHTKRYAYVYPDSGLWWKRFTESLERSLELKNAASEEIGSTHWFVKNSPVHQSLARTKTADGYVFVSNEKITDELIAVFEKKELRVHVFGSNITADERRDYDVREWKWMSSEEILPEDACDMFISIWYA